MNAGPAGGFVGRRLEARLIPAFLEGVPLPGASGQWDQVRGPPPIGYLRAAFSRYV